MSDRTLFRVTDDGSVTEMPGRRGSLGETLRQFVVRHMEAFLGARPVTSEYSTGRRDGHIDALGLADAGVPVVVQFERAPGENLLGRGLRCLDWLDDHRVEFERLVLERYGPDVAGAVDWSRPRVICVAGDFTDDDHAVAAALNPDVRLVTVVDHLGEIVEIETVAASEADVWAPRPEQRDPEGRDRDAWDRDRRRRGASRSDAPRSDTSRSESSRSDPSRPDGPRSDPSRPDAPRSRPGSREPAEAPREPDTRRERTTPRTSGAGSRGRSGHDGPPFATMGAAVADTPATATLSGPGRADTVPPPRTTARPAGPPRPDVADAVRRH